MSKDLDRKIDALLGEMREVNRRYDESGKASGDGGRKAAAMDGQADLAKKLTEVDDKKFDKDLKAQLRKQREEIDELKASLYSQRSPSKAASIGNGKAGSPFGGRIKNPGGMKPHPALKASFRDYQAGEFLTALSAAKGYLSDSLDLEMVQAGQAKLREFADWRGKAELSQAFMLLGMDGKATLGTTGATGGYVLPNNLVDTVIKPNVQKAIYQNMVTVINGVAVRGVDQPYRLSKPARATFADWGATKENVNETYGSYTATLGTLAKIYDVGKQYLRFSAGSAEQDVMDELTKSFALAENFAVIAGPGTGSATPGVNDPTYGIYTALAASAAFNGYSTSGFTAAAGTLAGSLANGLALSSAALASRNREAQAWVVDATTFWTAIGQGTDYAGFFVDPAGGPTGFGRTASGGLTFWNVPMYYDSNLGTNAATKIVIGGEWDVAKLYRGMEFRIDSSDVAGTRWDQNLVGFRGEEEIAIHAGTAVNVGAFQLLTSAIP